MTDICRALDPAFYPKSIAFVGVTTSNPQHWTRTFWNCARKFHFEGPTYAVNPRGGELDGCKVYASVDDIPGSIDYAVCTVNARTAADVLRRCAAKGAKVVHFCTAGFAETGEQDTALMQEELLRIAKETGVRIIGPNCMGVYCPESGISFDTVFSPEAGNVGFISQSGGNAIYTVIEANLRGVRFSKAVSYGNACDLNECDFLEYMIDDPKTDIIALYIEGLRDGKRFLQLIKKASQMKTVVLVKGGRGQAGARATATHTASIAGNDAMWDALCRQFNIIRARNVEELVDVLAILYFTPDLRGTNMLLIGPGGGASVLLTDEFEARGFRFPPVSDSMWEKLLGFSQTAGNMLRNPIDYSQSMLEPGSMSKAIRMLTEWEKVDFCVAFLRPSQMTEAYMNTINAMANVVTEAYQASVKPIVCIVEGSVDPERQRHTYGIMRGIVESGHTLCYSFPGAAEALRLVVQHNQLREKR